MSSKKKQKHQPSPEPSIICSVCGSGNVQCAMWVNPNTNEVHDDFGSWDYDDTKYCEDCGENNELLADPSDAEWKRLRRAYLARQRRAEASTP